MALPGDESNDEDDPQQVAHNNEEDDAVRDMLYAGAHQYALTDLQQSGENLYDDSGHGTFRTGESLSVNARSTIAACTEQALNPNTRFDFGYIPTGYLGDVEFISLHPDDQQMTLGQTEEKQVCAGTQRDPRYPEYQSFSRRKNSFPQVVVLDGTLMNKNELAAAGFFYETNNGCSYVRCFHCDSTPKMWKPGDRPSTRHIITAPRCRFMMYMYG